MLIRIFVEIIKHFFKKKIFFFIENILVGDENDLSLVKISDFGLSTQYSKDSILSFYS